MVRSLYIHVPFCNHKCHYCDFYSLVDTQGRFEAFTARLIRELGALAPAAGPLRTLFVGGGTPTLLPIDCWKHLLGCLHGCFQLSHDTEFTVECNPETAEAALFEVLVAGGVNRISLGAQSFHLQHLATLDRVHRPESLPRALEMARAAGIKRRSVDLIYAIPGQTLEEWRADLQQAIDLGTDHLSCYNLTYEPRTALTARLERGLVRPIEEELEVAMFELAGTLLEDAGFVRYEVSNYARPGQECRHNLAYWRQEEWLAAGPSASGHAGGFRWKNTPHLDTYLSHEIEGFAPVVDVEEPDAGRALRERIMTGLRLREGLDRADLQARIECVCPQKCGDFEARVTDLIARGWLVEEASVIRLGARGILFADGAASELMLSLV
ncbi:MAG: radical SAM family heme chaperone HemW [Phycisphaerales bacterium]|nr:radical SAM family heme chaperone HemW [Phycisphaerales bacterium]